MKMILLINDLTNTDGGPLLRLKNLHCAVLLETTYVLLLSTAIIKTIGIPIFCLKCIICVNCVAIENILHLCNDTVSFFRIFSGHNQKFPPLREGEILITVIYKYLDELNNSDVLIGEEIVHTTTKSKAYFTYKFCIFSKVAIL